MKRALLATFIGLMTFAAAQAQATTLHCKAATNALELLIPYEDEAGFPLAGPIVLKRVKIDLLKITSEDLDQYSNNESVITLNAPSKTDEVNPNGSPRPLLAVSVAYNETRKRHVGWMLYQGMQVGLLCSPTEQN